MPLAVYTICDLKIASLTVCDQTHGGIQGSWGKFYRHMPGAPQGQTLTLKGEKVYSPASSFYAGSAASCKHLTRWEKATVEY